MNVYGEGSAVAPTVWINLNKIQPLPTMHGQERVARWQQPQPTPAAPQSGTGAGNGKEKERFRVLVVGGGAAGVELAMALEHRLRPMLPEGGWVVIYCVCVHICGSGRQSKRRHPAQHHSH